MTNSDYLRTKAKLAVAKDIAEDFRLNTSLDTIIREYEARIREMEKPVEDRTGLVPFNF